MQTHIYDWLDKPIEKESIELQKVREFLDFKTREAWYKFKNIEKIKGLSVFCEYKDNQYKITGASRMGDVWLSLNYERENGYDKRVWIDECSNFSYIDNRVEEK